MVNNPKFESPKDLEKVNNTWEDTGGPDTVFYVVGCFICTDLKLHASKLKHSHV